MTGRFDSLGYVGRLLAVGIPWEQAEAQARTLSDLVGDTLATKADIAEMATKQDVRDIRGEIEVLRRDLTIRLGGMVALAVGAVAALVKLL